MYQCEFNFTHRNFPKKIGTVLWLLGYECALSVMTSCQSCISLLWATVYVLRVAESLCGVSLLSAIADVIVTGTDSRRNFLIVCLILLISCQASHARTPGAIQSSRL